MRSIIFLLVAVCICGVPRCASAGEIRVLSGELQDISRLDLEGAAKAKMTVYLVSAGDMLDGYLIEVVSDGQTVAKQVSDVYGELTFGGLGPRTYRVYLRKPENLALKSSVRISEIRLEKQE